MDNKKEFSKYCSRCYNEKETTKYQYCNICKTRIAKQIKYRNISDEKFKEIQQFVHNIKACDYNLRSIIEFYYIMHYWCDISLFVHKYWNWESSDIFPAMYNDLEEYIKLKKENKLKYE